MAQRDDGIEDVLSSVRRLVANDAGAARQRPAREASAAAAPMLLLGPACRVTEVEDPFQMISTLAQEEEDAREERALLRRDGADGDLETAGVLRLLPTARTDRGIGTGDGAEPDALGADGPAVDASLRTMVSETIAEAVGAELADGSDDKLRRVVRRMVREEMQRMLAADAAGD